MSLAENYSRTERFLHRLAFSNAFVRRVLSDLEDDLYKKEIAATRSGHEVFVSSVARAGTTLLMELLYDTGEFASFTYRHMPFIMSPLLWDRISSRFQRDAVARERAHGDGMNISYDSPEAFEEVVWLTHAGTAIVRDNGLAVLSRDDCPRELIDGLTQAIRKLLTLESRGAASEHPLRYLSKNNANISRLSVIQGTFPDAVVVVPFRPPLSHVASLMRQHERFLAEHAEDAFSRDYMRWLGHFEFGQNLKPMMFDDWHPDSIDAGGVGRDFWLRYWVAAYRHVLARADERIVFVDFDALRADGAGALERIAAALSLRNPDALVASAGRLRAPTTKPASDDGIPSDLSSEANDVFWELRARAV